MKKVILVFDGSQFSEGAFEFANFLNERNPILLTGVFLPQSDYTDLWSYSGGGISGNTFIPLLEDEDAGAIEKNILRFKSLCEKNNIQHRVHNDFNDFVLQGLKMESRFADLIILGGESFYENAAKGEPNDYLKDALHMVECPVMIVPEKFAFPKNNILLYDGSEDSVYAIKQYAYLFPELTGNETILVHIARHDKSIPDRVNIEELASRHFHNLTIQQLEFDPGKFLNTWLSDRKPGVVVSGSFGRSAFSQLLRKSFVSGVIGAHSIPVFITHQK